MNKAQQMQLDMLKEIGSISMGHAAKRLSELLNCRIDIAVPEVKQLHLEDIMDYIGSGEQITCGVCSRLEQGLTGTILMIYPDKMPLALLDICLGKKVRTMDALSDLEASAIAEMSNICLGGYLSALNQLTGFTIFCTPPQLAIDMLGALVEEMLLSIAENTDVISLIDTEFSIKNKKIKGFFLLSFEPSSQEKLLQLVAGRKDSL